MQGIGYKKGELIKESIEKRKARKQVIDKVTVKHFKTFNAYCVLSLNGVYLKEGSAYNDFYGIFTCVEGVFQDYALFWLKKYKLTQKSEVELSVVLETIVEIYENDQYKDEKTIDKQNVWSSKENWIDDIENKVLYLVNENYFPEIKYEPRWKVYCKKDYIKKFQIHSDTWNEMQKKGHIFRITKDK